MVFLPSKVLLCAAALASHVLGAVLDDIVYPREAVVGADAATDSSETPESVSRTYGGKKYSCKCYVGDKCWPSARTWNSLNSTVDGKLIVHIPPGAACHNTFNGPLGTVATYNAAACADATTNWPNEQWQVEKPAANLWTYFTNDTCNPTANPSEPCTLGYYGVYVIMATKKEHIKAGIDFARNNNIRLVIRNTGHDFIGRSTGWGALVINTHSFQEIDWIRKYRGPGSYSGGAVKLGAGIQARDILTKGHARQPPVIVVTGECPTVGITGGFVQGGGHGPWTTLKGFSADNVLAFEAITAAGKYVTANEDTNPDLFWALKGGGPASFAVILSVTMKTFPDVRSSGAILYINTTHTTDADVHWDGVRTFHKWSNHFVDSGLYVYFELLPGLSFRARPFVAIGKKKSELQADLQPFLNELKAKKIPFEFTISEFASSYDLYIDLFEDEAAGPTALTGGWMFNHDDVANRNDAIIESFKTVMNPRADLVGIMVGHLINPGHLNPVANSATHPAWRNATDLIISVLPVPVGASLAQKADLQKVLTYTMDDAMRNASRSGCTYVNEADPYQPNWQSHFWGSAYPRLKQIRQKWDPRGVFYAIATPGTEDWEVIEDGTRLCKKN